MKARIRKNQKDWHVYIFWILLGVFALLVIMDPAVNYTSVTSVSDNG